MLLTINQLQVKYGKQTALRITEPLSFDAGERIGIIGSNGAGKSTFVKALLGLVTYEGQISTQLTPNQMAVHMQSNSYAATMPVQYIMEAILNTKLSKNKEAQELISFFDFKPCLSKKFNALSGGQKQKLTIILVMLQKAELTFYDEVTSGLDFETRQKLVEKLVEWYRNKQDTLFVVSHYYEELEQLAQKLLILDNGKVVAFGKTQDLFQTYCGKVVYIMENTPQNQAITAGFPTLAAPEHLIALSCKDKASELNMVSLFMEYNINFKRSNCDIEILYMNTKKQAATKVSNSI